MCWNSTNSCDTPKWTEEFKSEHKYRALLKEKYPCIGVVPEKKKGPGIVGVTRK